ncbi:hypothetical protein P8452_09964 [Trifolium repens]|nr:hypothetical protein P8452_09964 [Trifolium repens]
MDHQHIVKWKGSKVPPFIYMLHKECMDPVKDVHPFLKNCNFELYVEATSGSFCDACGKDLLGYFYWCRETNYGLHPSCLTLKHKILKHDGTVRMTLSNVVPSDCVRCKQRHVVRDQFEGWSYVVNSDGKSCVHVSCFKDMILENLNTNGDTTTRSKGKERFILFSKLTLGILNVLFTWDISNVVDIVEAIVENFSEHH